MLGLLQLLALGLAVAILFATWQMVRRLRHPPRRTYAWAVSKGVPGDPSEIGPPDGPLAYEAFDLGELTGEAEWRGIGVWDVVGRAPDGPVVVMTPGWGESRVNGLVRLPTVASVASRVVLWDPRGLGETPGTCALGTGADVAALGRLVGWVGESSKLKAQSSNEGAVSVMLYGWSMGAGVSVVAGAVCAVRDAHCAPRIIGVIAESPYRLAWTPAFRVMHLAGMPWRVNGPLAFAWLGLRLMGSVRWQGFDRVEHASRLDVPLVVIHGTADEVCPVGDGRAIAAAAPQGRFVEIEGGGHNDLWTDARFAGECARAVREFLRDRREDTHHRGTEGTERAMG